MTYRIPPATPCLVRPVAGPEDAWRDHATRGELAFRRPVATREGKSIAWPWCDVVYEFEQGGWRLLVAGRDVVILSATVEVSDGQEDQQHFRVP